MELRTAASPKDVKYYTTERLREEFLIDDLFKKGEIKLVYSHIDRIITDVAVIVKNRCFFSIVVKKAACSFCLKQEILIHKIFHGFCLLV